MVGIGIDLYGIAKDLIEWYRKRKREKIPLERFKKHLKVKIRAKLHSTPANHFIEDLINRLDDEGKIYTDSTGHKYVLTQSFSFK